MGATVMMGGVSDCPGAGIVSGYLEIPPFLFPKAEVKGSTAAEAPRKQGAGSKIRSGNSSRGASSPERGAKYPKAIGVFF